MKLLIVLISYNRLEYTKKTLENLLKTIVVPHYIVSVDNNSTDGTQEWLQQQLDDGRINKLILNPENYYPGKATNIGWAEGLREYPEATFLMRCDNDMMFKNGWDINIEDYFDAIPELGQLGLDHNAISKDSNNKGQNLLHINGKLLDAWPGCVGGPNVIRRELWEKGARYDETPWHNNGPRTMQEDSRFSQTVFKLGYFLGHPTERFSYTFATEKNWGDYPEYYLKTMKERGYGDVYGQELAKLEKRVKRQSARNTTK